MTPARRLQGVAERQPLVSVVAGVFLYALGPVLLRGADASGPVIALWRSWFAVGILGVVTLVHLRFTGRRPSRRGMWWTARCGVMFAGNMLLFFSAVKMTSVVDVTLMQVVQPLVVAVLAARLFGERPGSRFRIWSVVAMVGAGVVVVGGSSGPDGDPLGMTFAALSICLFAVYFVWSKQARGEIDVVPFLWGVAAVAAVTLSIFSLATGEAAGSVRRSDVLIALGIAVTGSLGHFAATWPLRWVAANVPPLLQLAIPFIAGFLAWVFLDEGITLAHLVGGALTIVGVAGALVSPAGRRMVAREEAELATGAG